MTGSIARKVLSMFKQHPPPKLADYHLSDREKDILAGLIQGLSYKMIADQYFISIDTVRSHIKHIYEKLHVHSKSEAVARVLSSKPFL